MMFLSLENVLKLPMVYHFSSKNNSTLKPRNLFWVGTEFLCRVPFLRVRSPMPDLPSGSLFWSWLKCPSCLRCEKESILLLAESWIILTLREGRLDRFVQNLVPSFQDWNLWINPIISSIYLVFTTAQHVMGQQFNRWVTTPYTAQGGAACLYYRYVWECHCTSKLPFASSEICSHKRLNLMGLLWEILGENLA